METASSLAYLSVPTGSITHTMQLPDFHPHFNLPSSPTAYLVEHPSSSISSSIQQSLPLPPRSSHLQPKLLPQFRIRSFLDAKRVSNSAIRPSVKFTASRTTSLARSISACSACYSDFASSSAISFLFDPKYPFFFSRFAFLQHDLVGSTLNL